MDSILLLVLAAAAIVFMIFTTRNRNKKMKAEQERRSLEMVPGTRIMTRSGLFGTIVEFDGTDLTQPAKIEIAPGVIIEVHAQAVDFAPASSEPVEDAVDDEQDHTDAVDEESPIEDGPGAPTTQGGYTLNGETVDPGTGDTPKN